MTSDRFGEAIARFDAVHREDPRIVDGEPFAVTYHRRMSERLAAIAPDAPETVRLAARCQHIRRWAIPRSQFPEGPAGYKKWRSTLARHHADEATGILRAVGYDETTVDAVRALLTKKGLHRDPNTQLLEDVICLVFLDLELVAFAPKHDEAKLIDILRKTWAKMSERGHTAALEIAAALPTPLRELVIRAVG